MFRRHRKGWVVGIALGLVTATGIAIAAWLVSGPGRGAGGIATLQAPTLHANGGTDVPVWPGGEGVMYMGAFNNPNPVPVYLVGIENEGASFWGTTQPECAPYITINDVTLPRDEQYMLSAGAVAEGIEVPGATTVSLDIPSSCQGSHYAVMYGPTAFTWST